MTSRCADRNQRKRPRSSENKERPAAMGTAEDERGENLDSALFGSDSDSGGAEQEAKKEGVSTEPARATEGTPGATEEEGIRSIRRGRLRQWRGRGRGQGGCTRLGRGRGRREKQTRTGSSDYDVVVKGRSTPWGQLWARSCPRQAEQHRGRTSAGTTQRSRQDADHKEQFVVRWRVSGREGRVQRPPREVVGRLDLRWAMSTWTCFSRTSRTSMPACPPRGFRAHGGLLRSV